MTTQHDVAKRYKAAAGFSEAKLTELRNAIASIVPREATVITCGSFARREASAVSDCDYFVVLPGKSGAETCACGADVRPPAPSWLADLDKKILEIVPKPHGTSNSFGEIEFHDEMLLNIGGDDDTNAKISRRILLLLEGEWLSNEDGFRTLRKEILRRYIKDGMQDHQLALFLLNDIIRYYRTMAVDYEFKTVEDGKPWAIRNIKLMFSRKLMYASGLFSVATTADLAPDLKRKRLEDLFDMPVIDRMLSICGASSMERVLKHYDHFLEELSQKELHDHLNGLAPDARDDPRFRTLKNEGHHFTREILALFENTFGSVHPIRRAVIF